MRYLKAYVPKESTMFDCPECGGPGRIIDDDNGMLVLECEACGAVFELEMDDEEETEPEE